MLTIKQQNTKKEMGERTLCANRNIIVQNANLCTLAMTNTISNDNEETMERRTNQ